MTSLLRNIRTGKRTGTYFINQHLTKDHHFVFLLRVWVVASVTWISGFTVKIFTFVNNYVTSIRLWTITYSLWESNECGCGENQPVVRWMSDNIFPSGCDSSSCWISVAKDSRMSAIISGNSLKYRIKMTTLYLHQYYTYRWCETFCRIASQQSCRTAMFTILRFNVSDIISVFILNHVLVSDSSFWFRVQLELGSILDKSKIRVRETSESGRKSG